MEYYGNGLEDAVIRVAPNGDRYVKFKGKSEFKAHPQSKIAYGGQGFGYLYVFDEITEEQYRTFGKKWKYNDICEMEEI